mgnify:CR=1 FL=1
MDTQLFEDSAALFAACGSADTAVQAVAYRQLWQYLYRVAFHVARAQADQEALAQDCAQQALIRIHRKRESCDEPKAFRSWSRRIVSNLVIDELRRRQRLFPLEETSEANIKSANDGNSSLEGAVLSNLSLEQLRNLLHQSPMSERSQRVVIGRYLDDVDDEALAAAESDLAQEPVRPSHIQVTRSKNIRKLKKWDLLRDLLQK